MKRFPIFKTILLSIIILQSCERTNNTPDQSVEFSTEYIEEHKGKYSIEIPDAYELAHIVMAIKYKDSNSDYFIKKNTSYYNEVLAIFNQYRNLKIFGKFNYYEADFDNNYSFRTNSYRYHLDNNTIVSKGIYPVMWNSDIFGSLKNEIERLAMESDFNRFYLDHRDYYESQISLYESLIPIEDIWQWLESQFSSRYDCYKILISPLTTGSHNTHRFETPEYKETIMFVSGLHNDINADDTLAVALNIRYLFTEIDHNYVNPVSDNYRKEIENSMSNLGSWKKSNQINYLYENAYTVFNEYMTWAVYNIYVSEKFTGSHFDQIRQSTIDMMENRRGFIKFEEFDEYLLTLYQNNTDQNTLEDLYPEILQWIREND